MGNKILGRRSKSFYRGFNEKQINYLKEKFETMSKKGTLDKKLFMEAYKLTDAICDRYFSEVDFDENSEIDEYQFICSVHSLCSMTIQELGHIFYKILTRGKTELNMKNLLHFTKACLSYNAYLSKKTITEDEIIKSNKNKFHKYDYDKNGKFDLEEFVKICLKDEDYKMWMYNMGFLTKRQLDFQQQIYDLVDSDIGDEIDRHSKYKDSNQSKIKQGIQHRIEDDEFQIEEEQGEQSISAKKPWVNTIKNCKLGPENLQSPSQTLQLDHVFGYRSFDCRNNVKFDSKGRIVYHQAAIGIVMQPNNLEQSFIVKHHDDISCLDITQDTIVTGEVGAKPMLMVWQSNKQDGILKEKVVITEELKESLGNVCISKSKRLIAATCNDQNHTIVIYDHFKLLEKQQNITSTENGIIAFGNSTKNIIFDVKFTADEKCLAVATLRELLFVSFETGSLNQNRGVFGNFSITPTLCLLSLECKYKGDEKQYILSGMGNGSVYFWENEKCVKAVCGHSGSVSALAERKDCKSFVSGDKTGKIIIWNDKFQKEKTLTVPKTNCPSNMVVALSCNTYKQILIGTKSSDIYTLKIGDQFDRAKTVMRGHNEGNLWALTLHKTEPYIYTGGEDQRLIKWEYKTEKKLVMQKKCPYPIRSIDFNHKKKFILVGYSNGVIECFKAENLEKTEHIFKEIKNPDEQALNLIKFDKSGSLCAVGYQLPQFKIVLVVVGEKNMKKISQISVSSKVISLDFENQNSKYIKFNTSNFEYFVYDISDPKNPKKIRPDQVKDALWATHTLSFSPQTQGIMTEGVTEGDIICCERSRKYRNVFVVGDKYSKIKLFNFPSKQNQIFNKYIGHSNEVTGLQFDRDEKYLVSIGGEQKSLIVWKYDAKEIENQWFIKQLEPESDIEDENQFSEDRLKKTKMLDQFAAQEQEGEQALAVKPFLAEIKNPSDFKEKYNPRRDNKQPEESVSIKHVFGIRNKYLADEVRNQCKFSKGYKEIVFPTACLGVKMNINTNEQQFYHEHKEDIVSFAIDSKREVMATGQMAEKNPYKPRKKILSIYVWDINGKKVLNKLDGFHTIAVVLLEFSPNSKLLFSCGNDDKNTFAVYDWMSGSILYSGPVSRAKVNGISWKNDNEFVTCGNDHVKIWTGGKGKLGKIKGKSEGMFSCVASKHVYVTGSGDGGIYNWTGNISCDKIKAHAGKVQTLVHFKDCVYSGGDDGKILAWRTASNGSVSTPEKYFETRIAFQKQLQTISIHEEEFGVLGIDFSPHKELLVVTKGASVIYSSGKQAKVIHQGHYKGELWALSTRIDEGKDNLIVTGGDDRTVRLWDIENKKQVYRTYFSNKIRGLDWASRSDKIVIADARAKLFLYNSQLTKKYDEYTGKPFDFNKSEKKDPWVQQIKFSPDNKMIVYGCHGKSMYMEYVKMNGDKLEKSKHFTHGSSALLHLDWDTDSSAISLNTQAYEYMFYDSSAGRLTSSATADYRWATWTKKFGFPVQGIFQGVDYSDINTVCRDPTQRFLAVGYDDQSIRLFKYPCYIPKQVCKQFFGHSSHVTRIKFTSNYMVSLGGLDRTIIVWDISGLQKKDKMENTDGEESDGLDDIDEDVDLPNKAITRKPKPQKIEEFYEVEDEGDEFMAVKPWLGAIKQPTYDYPAQDRNPPEVKIKLEYVQGYRCKDSRQNIFFIDKQTIVFHAAAVVIYQNLRKNEQEILDPHNDDILSIDYHKDSNQVITGQLGPKPLVCLFKNGKLKHEFLSPVRKGVLAIAISPDGERAACAGMDQDHHVAVMDLEKGKTITSVKGTKKVITKIVWVNNNEFVSVGINHFKYWTIDGKSLTGKESRKRGNFVSVAYDEENKKVFTGGSKGSILPWRGSSYEKQIILQFNKKDASVVDCLTIYNNYLVAGTKDGFIFVLDKKSLKTLNTFHMETAFYESNVKSQYPSIRAVDILHDKMVVGTLGAEIYELQFNDLEKDKGFKSCKNILKCHYSPNNSWTNQVWGLHVHQDFIFTCSDDATLRCWSILKRKLLSCVSTNVGPDNIQLDKDKRTKDFSDSAKSRAVCVSPDGKQIIVGSKNGTVRVYTFNSTNYTMKFKSIFRHAKQWISDIKFAYNTLIIGSHDNAIYVYNYEDGQIKRKFRPMKKHSSYITHFDVSRDSCFLQSTCGAYQLLFWDLNTGKQITGGASMLRDQRWSSWTCNLGWPVQGIYPKCTDGTYINSVDRSNQSINKTIFKDDHRSPYLLAAGNDSGKVALYNYPCTLKSSTPKQGRGHSSHVTNVRWSNDDNFIISTGGEDQCVMYWKIDKK